MSIIALHGTEEKLYSSPHYQLDCGFLTQILNNANVQNINSVRFFI